MVSEYHPPRIISGSIQYCATQRCYACFRYDSVATVMTFRWDLIGARLQFWNALLGRLATVQLSQGTDDFRWNLCENGKFSVDSMYRALTQAKVSVDNNKKNMAHEGPTQTKDFCVVPSERGHFN